VSHLALPSPHFEADCDVIGVFRNKGDGSIEMAATRVPANAYQPASNSPAARMGSEWDCWGIPRRDGPRIPSNADSSGRRGPGSLCKNRAGQSFQNSGDAGIEVALVENRELGRMTDVLLIGASAPSGRLFASEFEWFRGRSSRPDRQRARVVFLMDLQRLPKLSPSRLGPRPHTPRLNTRLSLLLFLLYSAQGAVIPLFSLRLKELGFSPTEIGWCCATQAIGSLLAPLIAGQIADRWFAAERCIAVCSFLAAGLFWLLATLTSPAAVFAASLSLWLLLAPTTTLSTATCFTHLRDPRHEFGRVRMWGTVGWVLPGWLLGFWLAEGGILNRLVSWLGLGHPLPELADAFRLAAILAAVFGLYAFTLPHTPPRKGTGVTAPLAALRLLRGRAFFVYALCTFGICAALPFSSQVTPLLLDNLGVPKAWIPRLLTLAQASEVASLFVLPGVLRRLGVRGTMRLGLAAAVATLGGLALGRPVGLVLGALALYGLCISCYLVAGQMFLNHGARADIRASAQGLHSVLCGLGLLVGNLLVGEVRTWFAAEFAPTYAVGALLAAALLAVFALFFPREAPPAPQP
jgi:predicted MFS family arabinose efflux permease